MVGFPLLCWFSAVYYLLEGGVMIKWSGDVFLVGSFLAGKKSNSGPLLPVSLEDATPIVGWIFEPYSMLNFSCCGLDENRILGLLKKKKTEKKWGVGGW